MFKDDSIQNGVGLYANIDFDMPSGKGGLRANNDGHFMTKPMNDVPSSYDRIYLEAYQQLPIHSDKASGACSGLGTLRKSTGIQNLGITSAAGSQASASGHPGYGIDGIMV